MSEIKSSFTKDQIAKYKKDNNLEVFNLDQIVCKFMEQDMWINRFRTYIEASKGIIPGGNVGINWDIK